MTESSNANLTGLEESEKTIDLTFQSAKMGATVAVTFKREQTGAKQRST